MARSSTRSDLFISVGGDVAPLKAAMTAGKSVLNQFGTAAINIQAEVNKAFAGMAANAPAEAKRIEQAYTKTFAEIRRNAQAVIASPTGGGAVDILNAAGARQAAQAAEAEATALRNLADAAIRADKAAGGTNAAVRILAVTSESAAQEAAQHAAALRGQAGALDLVQAELGQAGAAQERSTRFGTRHVTSLQAQRAGMQQLSFQIGDVSQQFALGVRPQVIFAQQAGQIIQAFQIMNGGGNKFLKFLGGPWGIALSAATVVLVPLVAKLLEGNDALEDGVEKLKKDARETEVTRQAKERFTRTQEGVAAAIRDGTEATRKAIEAEKTSAEQANISAQANLRNEISIRNTTRARLDGAKALLDAQIARATGPGQSSEIAALGLGRIQGQVASVQADLDRQNALIAEAEARLQQTRIDLATEAARLMADPIEKLNLLYKQEADAARAAARATGEVTVARAKSLASELLGIEKRRAAAVAEEQKRQSDARTDRSGADLPKVTRNEVADVLGTTINPGGGLRSPAENKKAGGAANSYHLAGTAIDIPLTVNGKPLSKEGIRAALEEAGIKIKELLGPGDKNHDDHFHIAFAKKRLGGDEVAKQSAQRGGVGKRAVDKATDQNDAFAGKLQALSDREFEARTALVSGISEQAAVARQQVDAALNKYALAVEEDVHDGRLREEQGKELIAKSAAVALQEKANIDTRAANEATAKTLREQDEAMAQAVQFQLDELEHSAGMARINAERRDLQLQILDLVYQEKKRHLEYLLAQAELNKNTAEAARIQAEINQLPRQKERDQTKANAGNKSPLERYRDELPQSLADIQERLEEIQVTGLRSLENDLVSATTKALGLKGALGEVVDMLLRLAFQSAISAIGGNFKFGGGKASGGSVSGSKLYLVGERGPELFIPGASGTIIPNHVLAAATLPRVPRNLSGRAANDDGLRGGSRGGLRDVNYTIYAKDADSFRRSEGQIARQTRRRLGAS